MQHQQTHNKINGFNNSNNKTQENVFKIQTNDDQHSKNKNYNSTESLYSSSSSSSPNTTTTSSSSSSSTSTSCYVDLATSQEFLNLNTIPMLSATAAASTTAAVTSESIITSENINSSKILNQQLPNHVNNKNSSFISKNCNEAEEKTKMLINNNINNNSQDETLISENNKKTVFLNGSPEIIKKEYGSLKGSYKQMKENYLTEKKRITNDMLTIMKDEKIIVLADWLKIRNSLKSWIKLFVVLKPGILLLYKSDKMKSQGSWIGTILLNSCELLERPSKKHGFCFKLFHPLEKSIWASKGPDGESTLNVFLLPTFYLIFLAPSERIGNIWMDALELTMKSSNLIKRVLNTTPSTPQISNSCPSSSQTSNNMINSSSSQSNDQSTKFTKSNNSSSISNSTMITDLKENEIENEHFKDIDACDDINLTDSDKNSSDDDCSFNSSIIAASVNEDETVENSHYCQSPPEEFGELGNKGQTEEVGEETKSLIFCLFKQVRPGMDISKVILPTFILEPRSFLEKLSDFYYHSNLLSESVNSDDPYTRMKNVVKFYLSGFYKKPKGLKKPYNPTLGEIFRCYWDQPSTNSKTFYIAEQVSHHPPITAFYVTNRKEGFCIYGTILARSKFYGNSVSAIMDGRIKLILLNRDEEYVITMPYANCKGILIGKLTMELGGKINITCEKTGYSADIEFKLKPLLGGIEASNIIDGKIKFAKETIAVLNGKWDGEIYLQDKRLNEQILFWCPNKKIIDQRLKRFIVPIDEQKDYESEKLWLKVSHAIRLCDQNLATEEKSKIEQKQRENDLERKSKSINYSTKLFTYDNLNKEWIYNYFDLRPWDPQTDRFQYEYEFKITTKIKNNSKLEADLNNHLLLLTQSSSNSKEITIANKTDRLLSDDQSLLVQYSNLKYRLDQIEKKVDSINSTLNNILNSKTNDNSKFIFTKTQQNLIDNSIVNCLIRNKNNFFILILWSLSLLLALFSNRLKVF